MIEEGFVCPSNALMSTSVCEKPQEALVAFAAQSQDIAAVEGSSVSLTVARTGTKRACSAQPGWFPEGTCTPLECQQPECECQQPEGSSCSGDASTEAECL